MSKLKRKPKKMNNNLIGILIVLGIGVLVSAVFFLKTEPAKQVPVAAELPQAQLDRLMKEGKPTFVFFHSNNCYGCINMMETVSKVYPEFEDQIALVDVDVYDKNNANLLRKAQITGIPTQVFINKKGDGKVSIGVMESEELRMQLSSLLE
jgi:thiol-disulfide isomerase/thioredoxin